MKNLNAIDQLMLYKDKISLFKDLDEYEIITLVDDVIFRKYIRFEVIFSEGEQKDDYIYYIAKGSVNISTRGKDRVLKKIVTLDETSLIGEMKPILDEGRTATCVAGDNGVTAIGFTINQEQFAEYPRLYAKFYRNMAHILSTKIKELNEKLK
jgi:CRP-like cAMP-binding protein